MDWKKLSEEIEEKFKKRELYLQTEEGKKELERLKLYNKKIESYPKKINTFLKSLTKEQALSLADKFFEWEQKYQDRMYDENHVETQSNILSFLFDASEKYGKFKKKPTHFSSGYYKYMYHKFELICGQGCFIKVSRKDKNIL